MLFKLLTRLVWLALQESGQMGRWLSVLHVPLIALLVQAPVNAALVKQNMLSKLLTSLVWLALLEGGQMGYILVLHVLLTAFLVQAQLNAALVICNMLC